MMIINKLKTFTRNEDGLAFLESAFILPLLAVLLFGIFDIGTAIVINQKVTAASHMVSDLITRQMNVNETDIDEAFAAAQLVIDPYDRSLLGVEIVSIQFDEDDDPQTVWRRTHNMDENGDLPGAATGLGLDGEGVVAVTTQYEYTPVFSWVITGTIEMREVSYLRGRRTAVVKLEEEGS